MSKEKKKVKVGKKALAATYAAAPRPPSDEEAASCTAALCIASFASNDTTNPLLRLYYCSGVDYADEINTSFSFPGVLRGLLRMPHPFVSFLNKDDTFLAVESIAEPLLRLDPAHHCSLPTSDGGEQGEMYTPLVAALPVSSVRTRLSPMELSRMTFADVEHFYEGGRPFAAAFCLAMCFRRNASRVVRKEGGVVGVPDVVVAATLSVLVATAHPLLLLPSVLFPHSKVKGWNYPRLLLADVRNTLRLFPGQQTIQAGPYSVSSRFDGGNVMSVVYEMGEGVMDVPKLNIASMPDAGGNRMWFAFDVVRTDETAPDKVQIVVSEYAKNMALFVPKDGIVHRPVIARNHGTFRRIELPPTCEDIPGVEDKLSISFTVSFSGQSVAEAPPTIAARVNSMLQSPGRGKAVQRGGSIPARRVNSTPDALGPPLDASVAPLDTVLSLAFTYPYSHTRLMRSISSWNESKEIDLSASTSTTADGEPAPPPPPPPPILPNAGRKAMRTSLLTLSSDCLQVPVCTFAEPSVGGEGEKERSVRPVVYITARVHAGEVPASHMVHGIFAFLLSGDPRVVRLLKHYDIKIVPMLNPDGVARGFSRADARGVNLNRVYDDADLRHHAPVWAVCEEIESLQKSGREVFAFLDFHAHARKRGIFAYANELDGAEGDLQNLFGFLMNLRCSVFDYHGSNFSDAAFLKRNKGGSGRVALRKRFTLPIVFTIEANYCTGDTIAFSSGKPARTAGTIFTPSVYQTVGVGVICALLDLKREIDPERDTLPGFANTARVRRYLAASPIPGAKKRPTKTSQTPSPTHSKKDDKGGEGEAVIADEEEGEESQAPPSPKFEESEAA